VSVLAVAVSNAEEPKIFDLGKVLDDKEVVLVLLCHFVLVAARPSQVGKLGNIVIDFSDGLGWRFRWRLLDYERFWVLRDRLVDGVALRPACILRVIFVTNSVSLGGLRLPCFSECITRLCILRE